MNNDRFKFRVWDKDHYVRGLYTLNEDGYITDGRRIIVSCPGMVIERCTGLKDRNGRLIYEGDVLEYTYNDGTKAHFFVVWKERFAGYRVVDVDGYKVVKDNRPDMSFEDIIEFNVSGLCEWDANHKMEVVGNIHEPKWGIESDDDKSYKTNKSYGDDGKSEVKE